MVAQKYKKEMLEEIFIFKCLPTRNATNQYLQNSLDSFRPYGSPRKLFLPENDFKTCFALNFKMDENMKIKVVNIFTPSRP